MIDLHLKSAGEGTGEASSLRGLRLVASPGARIELSVERALEAARLIRILALYDDTWEGEYLLAGRDARSLSLAERVEARFRLLGICNTSDGLAPHLSVGEHLELRIPPEGSRMERRFLIEPWLVRLDLQKHSRNPAGDLSAEEQQRLATACALIARPPVLVIDATTPTGRTLESLIVEHAPIDAAIIRISSGKFLRLRHRLPAPSGVVSTVERRSVPQR